MGMLFTSDAVSYIEFSLNNLFNHGPNGLSDWQSGSAAADTFRTDLRDSLIDLNPALGEVTINDLGLNIADSTNGEAPSVGADPSGGRSYRRWIFFWQKFRKKFPTQYKLLVTEILKVLTGGEPAVKGMAFTAIEVDSSSDVGVTIAYRQLYAKNYKIFTLHTKRWHTL
jgi:hypothetical protein